MTTRPRFTSSTAMPQGPFLCPVKHVAAPVAACTGPTHRSHGDWTAMARYVHDLNTFSTTDQPPKSPQRLVTSLPTKANMALGCMSTAISMRTPTHAHACAGPAEPSSQLERRDACGTHFLISEAAVWCVAREPCQPRLRCRSVWHATLPRTRPHTRSGGMSTLLVHTKLEV